MKVITDRKMQAIRLESLAPSARGPSLITVLYARRRQVREVMLNRRYERKVTALYSQETLHEDWQATC